MTPLLFLLHCVEAGISIADLDLLAISGDRYVGGERQR